MTTVSIISNSENIRNHTPFNLQSNQGRFDLTDNEMRMLACFAMALQRKKQSRYLEIGVYGGGTIKFVTDHARGIESTGVDLFEDFVYTHDNTHVSPNFTLENVQSFLGNGIRLIKGDSTKVLPELITNDEKFDLIFIDGNHKYEATKIDYNNSLKLLNPGGFIAFHNCSTGGAPDWEGYNVIDGGPWQLTMELKMYSHLKCVGEVDRLAVFGLPGT